MERYFRLEIKLEKILLTSLILFLFSCSEINKQRISPAYFEAYEAISRYFFQTDNELLTQEVIENIPYASAILKIGRGKPGLIILEKKIDNKEYWISADGVYIVTKNGRIVQTQGLSNNLKFFKTNNDKVSLETINFKNYLTYDQPTLFDLPIEVNAKPLGQEKVNLLKGDTSLFLVEEEINNYKINWYALNRFWLDEDGYVWKSEQNISPKLPTFYMEITKPYK